MADTIITCAAICEYCFYFGTSLYIPCCMCVWACVRVECLARFEMSLIRVCALYIVSLLLCSLDFCLITINCTQKEQLKKYLKIICCTDFNQMNLYYPLPSNHTCIVHRLFHTTSEKHLVCVVAKQKRVMREVRVSSRSTYIFRLLHQYSIAQRLTDKERCSERSLKKANKS